MLKLIDIQTWVTDEDGGRHAPYTVFEASSAWYGRMCRIVRTLMTHDDYTFNVMSRYSIDTIRQICKNRGIAKYAELQELDARDDELQILQAFALDLDTPLPELQAKAAKLIAICRDIPEDHEDAAPLIPDDEDDEDTPTLDLAALTKARNADDFKSVRELLRSVGITGKGKADLYPQADELIAAG